MKKVLVLGVAIVGLAAMTSCKKDYTCSVTFLGTTISSDHKDVSKSDAKDLKESCEKGGGTWAVK